MKVTLAFDLPDERHEMLAALHGSTYESALNDLDREMRNHLKHGTPLTIEDLRRLLHVLLESTPWQD